MKCIPDDKITVKLYHPGAGGFHRVNYADVPAKMLRRAFLYVPLCLWLYYYSYK